MMILSGYQLMVRSFAAQRPTLNNIWNEVFLPNGPQEKSLIEISGAPGTGKSLLLYELMARATLSTFYGGKHAQIIFIDLSHKFDLNVFIDIVQNTMNRHFMVSSQRPLVDSLKWPCESIINVPCYSADQFEIAFEDIEELLWDNKRVSMIAIDALDTFYWDECNHQVQRMNTHYKKLIQRLKPICQEHNICCAYTVDANYLMTKSKSCAYFPHSLIDYKLKLVKHNDGRRYLNDSLINFNFNSIKFGANIKNV